MSKLYPFWRQSFQSCSGLHSDNQTRLWILLAVLLVLSTYIIFLNYRISRFHVGSIIVHYFWHFRFITGGAFNLFFVLSHGKCLNLGEQRRLEKRLNAFNAFKILAKADEQAFPGVLGTCGGLGGFLEGPTASAWHRRRLAMGQSRLLSPSKAWRASRACTAW